MGLIMLAVTKMRCKYAPKKSEFYQLQVTIGIYFLIKSLELQKLGAWNYRKLNIYVMAHDYCGIGLKDNTICKKANMAIKVFQQVFQKSTVKPIATDLQLKAIWSWYFAFIEDLESTPADVYDTALNAAYTKESIGVKSGNYATRETLYESDLKHGLIYEAA